MRLTSKKNSKTKREIKESTKKATSVAAIDLRTSSFKTKWTCNMRTSLGLLHWQRKANPELVSERTIWNQTTGIFNTLAGESRISTYLWVDVSALNIILVAKVLSTQDIVALFPSLDLIVGVYLWSDCSRAIFFFNTRAVHMVAMNQFNCRWCH